VLAETQVMYTHAGPQLGLQLLGKNTTNQDVIPYYSVYFNDAWHIKPNFTLVRRQPAPFGTYNIELQTYRFLQTVGRPREE
jgi:hypothetical protein